MIWGNSCDVYKAIACQYDPELNIQLIELRLLFESQNSKPQNIDLQAQKALWEH
jgi:hypothetical protein